MRWGRGIAVVGLVVLAGCASTHRFPGTRVEFSTGGSSSSSPSCDFSSSTLSGLVDSADKVVVATVTAVTPQFDEAYAGSDVSEQATSPLVRTADYLNRELTLDVERVIVDRDQRPWGAVEVPGWEVRGDDGVWTELDFYDNHRLQVGDRAVLALVAVPGETIHGVACTGPFLLRDGQVVPKDVGTPRLLEFGNEGPRGISAYDMTEQELVDTLTLLATD